MQVVYFSAQIKAKWVFSRQHFKRIIWMKSDGSKQTTQPRQDFIFQYKTKGSKRTSLQNKALYFTSVCNIFDQIEKFTSFWNIFNC